MDGMTESELTVLVAQAPTFTYITLLSTYAYSTHLCKNIHTFTYLDISRSLEEEQEPAYKIWARCLTQGRTNINNLILIV